MRRVGAGVDNSSAPARAAAPAAAKAPLQAKNCRREPQHEHARLCMGLLSFHCLFIQCSFTRPDFKLWLLEHRSLAGDEFGDLGTFVWHVNGHYLAHGDEFPAVRRTAIMYRGSFVPKHVAVAVNAIGIG